MTYSIHKGLAHSAERLKSGYEVRAWACPQHRHAVPFHACGYGVARDALPLPGPKDSHFKRVVRLLQFSSPHLPRAGSAHARPLDSQGLDVCQVLVPPTRAFINRKKSWKSRGSGIIGMRSLAQEFHCFKAFHHRLSAPEPRIAPGVAQIHHCDLRPIDARIPGQWRYHRIT